MEWILNKNNDDSYPKDGQYIVIIERGTNNPQVVIYDDMNGLFYVDNGKWIYTDIKWRHVSHWIPLPNIPEVNSKPNQLTNYLMDKFEPVLKKLSDS